MRYFGGKAKIAKPLAAFLNQQLKPGQPFVDLFCGSCNVISLIDPARQRIANDIHRELIALHKYVQNGGELPDVVSEKEYAQLKADRGGVLYPDWLKGFAGFGCSFAGRWFEGYARGGEQDYAGAAKRGLTKKHKNLSGVEFLNTDYRDVPLPEKSLIYCDIPYKSSVKKYKDGWFNHDEFYKWVENIVVDGGTVFVSEYEESVPDTWEVVWRHNSRRGVRDKNGIHQRTVEVLCRPRA